MGVLDLYRRRHEEIILRHIEENCGSVLGRRNEEPILRDIEKTVERVFRRVTEYDCDCVNGQYLLRALSPNHLKSTV